MAYSDGPRGIGGWLAFFLFFRAIGPLLAVGSILFYVYGNQQVIAFYADRWVAVQIGQWCLVALFTIIDWFLVWRFVTRRNWRTVQIGIGLLIALAVTSLVLAPLIVVFTGGLPLSRFGAALSPVSILQSIVFTTVWIAYLMRSKRVANTYLRYGPVDADDLSQVFE
jgi:hypothetical protein